MSLVLRNPLKVDVMRDRGALAREAAPGVIENVYRLQIMNTDETPRRFTMTATGLPGLDGRRRRRAAAARRRDRADGAAAAAGRRRTTTSRATAAGDGAQRKRSHKIEIVVEAVDDPKVVRREDSSFLFPR